MRGGTGRVIRSQEWSVDRANETRRPAQIVVCTRVSPVPSTSTRAHSLEFPTISIPGSGLQRIIGSDEKTTTRRGCNCRLALEPEYIFGVVETEYGLTQVGAPSQLPVIYLTKQHQTSHWTSPRCRLQRPLHLRSQVALIIILGNGRMAEPCYDVLSYRIAHHAALVSSQSHNQQDPFERRIPGDPCGTPTPGQQASPGDRRNDHRPSFLRPVQPPRMLLDLLFLVYRRCSSPS